MCSTRRPTSYFVDAAGPRVGRVALLVLAAALVGALTLASPDAPAAGGDSADAVSAEPEPDEPDVTARDLEPVAARGMPARRAAAAG